MQLENALFAVSRRKHLQIVTILKIIRQSNRLFKQKFLQIVKHALTDLKQRSDPL